MMRGEVMNQESSKQGREMRSNEIVGEEYMVGTASLSERLTDECSFKDDIVHEQSSIS